MSPLAYFERVAIKVRDWLDRGSYPLRTPEPRRKGRGALAYLSTSGTSGGRVISFRSTYSCETWTDGPSTASKS